MIHEILGSLRSLREELLSESAAHAACASQYEVTSAVHCLETGYATAKSSAAARLEVILMWLSPVEIPIVRIAAYREKCCAQCGAPLDSQEARSFETCENCFYAFLD